LLPRVTYTLEVISCQSKFGWGKTGKRRKIAKMGADL
jgi:hypothetical protein